MKKVKLTAALLGLLLSGAAYGQQGREIAAGQGIAPYRLEVTFSKTVHLIFPSAVKYVDLGSSDIIAGKADGVENVVRVKAAVEGFSEETNFSVITSDGTFYSFIVVYADQPALLNINMDQWKTAESPVPVGGGVQVAELGAQDPALVHQLMRTIYERNRRDLKQIGSREFGMTALLRGIYVYRDLLFLHVSLDNASNVPFDVDFIRFRIVDKKVAKRTAQQETTIEPVRTYSALTRIEGQSSGRMVYAFGKITIPDDKFLEVEIYEKDGSRHQRFHIENADLVAARLIERLKK